MGMFDSFYEGPVDEFGPEWQTKAYACVLDRFWVGDRIESLDGLDSYQLEVIGGDTEERPLIRDSLATVVDGFLRELDAPRDPSPPLFDKFGHRVDEGRRIAWAGQ